MYNEIFWFSIFLMLLQVFVIGWQKTSDKTYQIPEWETIQMNYSTCIFMYVVYHFLNKWW